MDLAIGVSELKQHVNADDTLTERLQKTMVAAQNLWFTTNDDLRFRCAVGAVMVKSTPEEQGIIRQSLAPLKALQAAINGVPIDWEAVLLEKPDELLPLMKMWREAKQADEDRMKQLVQHSAPSGGNRL